MPGSIEILTKAVALVVIPKESNPKKQQPTSQGPFRHFMPYMGRGRGRPGQQESNPGFNPWNVAVHNFKIINVK